MNFPFCQPPGVPPRPCPDIFFSAEPLQYSKLSADRAAPLPTIIETVSIQFRSLPDSSGSPQEESGTAILLQAAYLSGTGFMQISHFHSSY